MNTYIGIDLGTSSVKLILMGEDGRVLRTLSRSYPVDYPHPGWSEQDPLDWYVETIAGLLLLLNGVDATSVRALAVAGQMHGLVVLDDQDRVIRPAILWNDGRTQKETTWLNEKIGQKTLSDRTGNIAFAGFTAPKLLWMQKNEPENFARIAKIMLPKDYLVYRLTGVHCCDPSDASGTLFYDVKNRCWSAEMMELCGISAAQLGTVYESYQPVGTLLPQISEKLGLGKVLVAAGAGDNAAAAIGTGCVSEGQMNLSLGTSGTLFIPCNEFAVDKNNALHAFAHANGKYHLMGCMLSAASCGKWWLEDVLGTRDYSGEMDFSDPDNNVYFLPYLMGERSPHNDAQAKGVFFGLRMDSTRQQMTQAVYTGVTFALRDSLEVARSMGVSPVTATLCGGGAKSPQWRQLVADVLNLTLQIPVAEEGPGMGAAILAAVACGAFPTVEAATKQLVAIQGEVIPNPASVKAYERRYQFFRRLYPAMKDLFQEE